MPESETICIKDLNKNCTCRECKRVHSSQQQETPNKEQSPNSTVSQPSFTVPLLDQDKESRSQFYKVKPFDSMNGKAAIKFPPLKEATVYVLGYEDRKRYVGMSCNFRQRLFDHIRGEGAVDMKDYKLTDLLYAIKCKDRDEALDWERTLQARVTDGEEFAPIGEKYANLWNTIKTAWDKYVESGELANYEENVRGLVKELGRENEGGIVSEKKERRTYLLGWKGGPGETTTKFAMNDLFPGRTLKDES